MEPFNQPVTSREYKLMLNVDRFQNRAEGAAAFWRLIKFLVEEKLGGAIVKEQVKEDVRRTHYRDTVGLDLRRSGFVLRVRAEGERSKEYKTTLKYRDSDRYISAFQNVHSAKPKKEDHKFEEDIIPAFVSKFSQSSSLISKDPLDLDKMANVTKIFPGLDELKLPGSSQVDRVNTFEAYEVRRKIGQFKFELDENPNEDEVTIVKACLSFWYLQKNELPLVGEFSFDYDLTPKPKLEDQHQLEQFPTKVASGANNLFRILQKQPGWFDLEGTTKTAYAYSAF